MKTIKLMLLLTALLPFMACNKDNDNSVDDTGATEEGHIMISIDATKVVSKAPRATDPGSTAENKINSMHVFLFNKDGVGAPTVVHLNNTQFTTSGTGITSLVRPIRTSIKDKWGYVGVNLTQSMIGNINSQRINLTDVAFTQAITDLANVSGESFVMFTDEIDVPAASIFNTEEMANNAPITASLRRLSSKANVYYNNTIYEGAGTYAEGEAEFAWRRINNQIFYVQKQDYTDPNYQPGDFITSFQNNTQTYLPLNPDITTLTNIQYTTENTFDYTDPTILSKDATCISIRIPFQPANYTVKNGTDWEASPNSNQPAYDGTDFYIVRVNGGITYYFSSNAIANDFWIDATNGNISINGVQITPDEASYTQRRYINGVCYYNIYPNSNGANNGDQYRFNIFRNQYYRLALRKLTAPGDPNWDFDNNLPITEQGYIQFNLTVEEWEVFDEDIYM